MTALPPEQQALQFLQAGRLDEAERLYREILRADPSHARAQHFLGIIRFQQGRHAEALDLIGRSLQSRADADALSNYGNVLQAMGRFGEALARYDRALALKPELINALYNRGVTLTSMKRPGEALASYDRALAIAPGDPDIAMNRIPLLIELKRADEALAAADTLLAAAPDYAEAWNNRGNALQALDRFAEALASYDRVLALKPDYAEAFFNRGSVLQSLSRGDEALASFAQAVAADPAFAEGWYNHAVALQAALRLDEALASYDRALALRPAYAEASFQRANVLGDLKRQAEALAGYDRTLALAPGHRHAWINRGTVLWAMNRIAEAEASYGGALALKPDDAETLTNRGNMLWAEKRELGCAISDLEQAARANPDHPYLLGDLLHLKMWAADWTDFEQHSMALDAAVRAGRRVAQPLCYLALSDSPADLKACAQTYTAHLYPPAPRDWPKTDRRRRKIRLGYLCGEFREHPIGYLTAGLFEHHDKSRFEIVALDNGWNDASPTRRRMEVAFDTFIDVAKLSDRAVAEKIHAGEIDILIDVNGYTRNHRIGVFAQRPAPVQVQYLGFPGTLGASYIDYIIADPVLIPENQRRHYTENVVTLPDTYQANDSRRAAPLPPPSRAACGLPEAGIVFCNFNQSYKITPAIFAAWMRILKSLDGSVLWLLESNALCRENLRRAAMAEGVAASRLVFAPMTPQDRHLARLQLADLCLDTLPYNAHTTGSDALWAGVPLVTCRGQAFAGRVAASLLTAIGLPELITDSLADYEALSIALARDPARLRSLRDRLARNRLSTPLFDTARYCRNIEQAYATMWDMHQRGEAARSFAVTSC